MNHFFAGKNRVELKGCSSSQKKFRPKCSTYQVENGLEVINQKVSRRVGAEIKVAFVLSKNLHKMVFSSSQKQFKEFEEI